MFTACRHQFRDRFVLGKTYSRPPKREIKKLSKQIKSRKALTEQRTKAYTALAHLNILLATSFCLQSLMHDTLV